MANFPLNMTHDVVFDWHVECPQRAEFEDAAIRAMIVSRPNHTLSRCDQGSTDEAVFAIETSDAGKRAVKALYPEWANFCDIMVLPRQ